MATPAPVVPKEKFCVVCGQGSHRLDWQDTASPVCDKGVHSDEELAAAKAKASGLKAVPSPSDTSSGNKRAV